MSGRTRVVAALAGAALAVGAVVAWVATRPGHPAAPAVASAQSMVAPDGVLDISRVSPAVAGEFHYAAGHLDAYRQLRCWCGCVEAFRHQSLADCFVRADGQWEAHGAGCGVCIAEAMVARQRLDAGVPVTEIARELDDEFGPDPGSTT